MSTEEGAYARSDLLRDIARLAPASLVPRRRNPVRVPVQSQARHSSAVAVIATDADLFACYACAQTIASFSPFAR
uniref:Uncharacterized protein n=1 Tax=Mycena chlorophos TaxID=658473 RepID=A0ABQ0L1Y5_MYCCL|nr:predicted protein [Mycena chlorophos]